MNSPYASIDVQHPAAGAAVAVFTGEHDLATTEAVRSLLGSLIEENELVVADLSQVAFLDGSIVRELRSADQRARVAGRRLRLQVGTAHIVDMVLHLSGVLEELECRPTREEALSDSTH